MVSALLQEALDLAAESDATMSKHGNGYGGENRVNTLKKSENRQKLETP